MHDLYSISIIIIIIIIIIIFVSSNVAHSIVKK